MLLAAVELERQLCGKLNRLSFDWVIVLRRQWIASCTRALHSWYLVGVWARGVRSCFPLFARDSLECICIASPQAAGTVKLASLAESPLLRCTCGKQHMTLTV